MAFTVLPYTTTFVGAATFQDMAAATDADFTQRNTHYTFTEQYQLLYDYWNGVDVTDGRYQVPTWNAIGQFAAWPLDLGTNVPQSPPRLFRYVDYPPQIPMNEEFQMQTTASAASQATGAVIVGTTDWNANIPRGKTRIRVKATAAVASLSLAWSGPNPFTLAASLRGGVYAVVGAALQCATYGLLFRLIFPRTKLYHGRKLRPGWICNNALGDLDAAIVAASPCHLGVWGYFHTFELPSFEFWGNAAHAATQILILDLVYLGESITLLDQYISGGSATGT